LRKGGLIVRLDVRKLALFLLLIAPAAQAQLWSGLAAVEVRVEDQKGLPVADAKLVFQYNALDPKDGPPPVMTDSRGKATVSGLAEGSWHLEVSHDGFMSYLAEITIRPKGRIVLDEAAQFNVVGATRTMQVQISRGKAVSVPRAPVVAETPAPTPAPRPVAPPAPAPAQPEPAAPAPPPAKPVRPPAPAPEPAAPTVLPAPQPEKPPVPEPPPARPNPSPAPIPPPTTPAPVLEPAIRPAPPAPAPAPPTPADPVRLRTSKDRTCFECPPGESALSTERVIAPGGGASCGGDLASQLQSGSIPSSLPAGCHVLRIALPAGTRFTGYRYEIQIGGDNLDCLAGQSCPQSAGRFPINPVLVRRPQGTIVLAPFESGPADRERRAVLTAYFSEGTANRPRQ
jgi:hypothetical protein